MKMWSVQIPNGIETDAMDSILCLILISCEDFIRARFVSMMMAYRMHACWLCVAMMTITTMRRWRRMWDEMWAFQSFVFFFLRLHHLKWICRRCTIAGLPFLTVSPFYIAAHFIWHEFGVAIRIHLWEMPWFENKFVLFIWIAHNAYCS